MKKITLAYLCMLLTLSLFAGKDGDTSTLDTKRLMDYVKLMDSVNKVLKYQTGLVMLDNGITQLNIPAGFKFLNKEQSKFVISDLWGNPPREDILGMIFPDTDDPFSDSSYAFIVSYDPIGYVKDGDADKINYDDMLKEMQNSEKEENTERIKSGYQAIHFVGWAQKPFYDKNKKVLHWAKELNFGDEESNTLNYEVRILGRKGVLSLNAVASMSELALVNKDIDKVLGMASFTEGNTYAEFDSKIDDVAAWTIGGLVAGKVLAKVGFFALLLKNIKLVVLGLVAFGGAAWRFITGRKKKEEDLPEESTEV